MPTATGNVPRWFAFLLAGLISLLVLVALPRGGSSATPTNLLLNPGFELDANGDGRADAWSSNRYFSRAAGGENSTYAGRWSSTENKGPSSYQQVNVSAGTRYTFSGSVNAPTSSDAFTFQIKILWRNASGAINATVIRKLTDDTGGTWHLVTGSAVAPAGATIARVQMVTGSLAATIYVDNFHFAADVASLPTSTPSPASTPSPTIAPTPPAAGTAVLVGAGDIANCRTTADEATATLLDGIDGTIFAAGDNAYPDGSQANFAECYGPTWGRHKARTRPAPGNHDYHVPGASGYYDYFGELAGPTGLGYYAYDLGGWRVYSLNSAVITAAQLDWLASDLADNPRSCIAAYWHHPRYATPYPNGTHASDDDLEPFWTALTGAGADLVINGHGHHYERFEPIRGITQVIVGTGGTNLQGFSSDIAPGSVVRQSIAHGVLKVELGPSGFDATFVPVAGQTFSDSFGAQC